MTFRFDNILEEWAQNYKPLSHNPAKNAKDCTFYRIRTLNTDNAFARNQNMAKSPCMAYSVLIDAETKGTKAVSYLHTIYFLSRATATSLAKNAKQDDELGCDQQLLLDEMVQDLLAYLWKLRHDGKNSITGQTYDRATTEALRGLDLDGADWASAPIPLGGVKFADWHVMGLQIEQIAPRLLCVNEEKYITPPSE